MFFLALSFLSVSSIAFSLTANRFQLYVTENEAQQPDSNLPGIPNTMMPPKNQGLGTSQGKKIWSSMTIVEILSKDSSFSNLNKALKISGLLRHTLQPMKLPYLLPMIKPLPNCPPML